MTFESTVTAVPQLRHAYRRGLQALRGRDRARVRCPQARRLTGSVYLDEGLKTACPGEPRWDYGLGHKSGDGEAAVWVEVHPASSSHVADVITKAAWLKNWLRTSAPVLLSMTRPADGFVWLATGSVSLQKGSPQAWRLAKAGVSFPRPILCLP